ncbi:MAG: hypothetical protein QM621_00905 [Aeromicrobium sp.]|uniref:hypothetical protein n=1 Tax=Aeromicrobium sp. TaxID=1871063 RepID=UPI0039E524C8
MNEESPFEIHRRVGLYAALAAASLLVALGFAYFAVARSAWLWIAVALFVVLALVLLRGVLDPKTPLFVADEQGVRLQTKDGWTGLLWGDLGEIRIEPRHGLWRESRIRVISLDGDREYATPVGFTTTVDVERAEAELARRYDAAAY